MAPKAPANVGGAAGDNRNSCGAIWLVCVALEVAQTALSARVKLDDATSVGGGGGLCMMGWVRTMEPAGSKQVIVFDVSVVTAGETERESSGGLRAPRPDLTDTFSKLLLLGPLELE